MIPYDLFAPKSYVEASTAVRDAHTNGCGAGVMAVLIPDTMYGLDVSEACDIHDWMYGEGETIADKDEADRVFLNNLIRIIEAKTRWAWLKRLRLRRARTYYLAVHHFGGPWYWQDKNPAENLYPATA